ncbi:metallopeptidase family protein [Acidipropionibacterium jensenii]|uniref:metallopeptidase family protein n=1 Tax=Acidipropionibacterium jensenii TaxID=1749 RepID=UPI00048B8400|nr:metallopeptidase family protein [Acidipropionibacterium jensenii]MDN6020579.1 metallopeptidase family protein [Acidipropionibacterium jensenii]
MSSRRDRHGRGMRGPLVVPAALGGVVPSPRPTRSEFFAEAVGSALARISQTCPAALDRLVVGVEDVPERQSFIENHVPLTSAQDGDEHHPAKVVLFRRPLEMRAATPQGLVILVHRTLVEQLSALTGLPVDVIDPGAEFD